MKLDIKWLLYGNTIYAAGIIFVDYKAISTAWKLADDGTVTELFRIQPSETGISTASHGIYVLNGSVYISGDELQTGYSGCKLFCAKDGVAQYLTDGSAPCNAYGICATASHVYVAGAGQDKTANRAFARLWTDGTENILDNSSDTRNSYALNVTTKGDDVYVVGVQQNNFNNNDLIYIWKNGVQTPITDGSKYAYCYSILVK